MSAPFPPKRILAAFDGSPPGRAALRTAAALALETGAALEAAFVEPPPVALPYELDPLDTGAARALQKESDRFKRQWHDDARAETAALPGGRVTLTWATGWPVDALLERLETSGAQLLVVGTHGRSGLERLLLGSVAEQLLRRSPVPVLVVPAPAPASARRAGSRRRAGKPRRTPWTAPKTRPL